MSFSLVVVCCSYALICRKDRSWINWATSWFIFSVAANYILPFAYLLIVDSSWSLYAYSYCYATYAGSFFAAAVTYRWVKPMRLVPSRSTPCPEIRTLPWILLALGFAFYLPVLIEYRTLLLHPRDIYMQTRTGYGLWFFGSSMFVNLGFVTYLFKANRTRTGALTFFLCCAIIIYLHGSKGQLLSLLMIWILYRVYAKGKLATISSAIRTGLAISLLVISSFAFFATDVTGISDLLLTMMSYSDYSRNAMMVIDDREANSHWGMLAFENELFSRVPRAIMPDKPKDFGEFALAKKYYPDWFSDDTGSPSFGIGFQYADFGPFTIFVIMFGSVFTGWAVRSLTEAIRLRPHPSYLLGLLFFSGVAIIPAGEGYFLPETILLALGISFLLRFRFTVI